MNHFRLLSFAVLIAGALSTAICEAQNTRAKAQIAPQKPDLLLAEAIKAAPDPAKYPNALAIHLLDVTDITVHGDGTVFTKTRETYKLLNRNARSLAEVNIPYNQSYQTITLDKAETRQKNGKVLKVKESELLEYSPYTDFPLYNDAKGFGFSMPGVEDDCIIDYSYKMVSKPLLMRGQFWEFWRFNGEHPVVLSRMIVRAPISMKFNYRMHNSPGFEPEISLSANGKEKVYKWERRNLPPIVPEYGMPATREITMWLECSTLDSWNQVGAWFWGLYKGQATTSPAITESVATLIAGLEKQEDRARVLYDWVADKTRYVALEMGISAFRPHPAAQVHEKLYGDCKDKATLLITMLKQAGITAHPVLLMAQEKTDLSSELPKPAAFNHCIVQAEVNGKKVWLDPTDEDCPYGDIPFPDRGRYVLVVKEKGSVLEMVPAYTADENTIDIFEEITMQPDGSAELHTLATTRGLFGEGNRASFRELPVEKQKEAVLNIVSSYGSSADLITFKISDVKRKELAFNIDATAHVTEFSRSISNLLVFSLHPSHGKNPFAMYTTTGRVYPLVQDVLSGVHRSTVIHLPKGYSIDTLGSALSIDTGIELIKRSVTTSKDGRSITVDWLTRSKEGRILPADYAEFRAKLMSANVAFGDSYTLKRN